jgi:hypothetical protein
VVLVLLLAVWASLEPASPQAHDNQLRCKYAQQQKGGAGTPNYPVLLCDSGHAEGQEYAAYAAVKHGEADALVPAFRHWLDGIVRDPVKLFTGLLAISTIFLWLSTRRLWRGAEAQAVDFRKSIVAAERSATAMEGVSTAMGENATLMKETVGFQKDVVASQRLFGQLQMRAYVSVLIGGAYHQEPGGAKPFAARPAIKNTGHTAARQLKWRIAADILPVPLPADFRFPIPADAEGSSLLGPQQDGTMFAEAPGLVPDNEIADIKAGNGKALYVWGYLRYRDAFGRLHRNTFAQQMYWIPNPAHPFVPGAAPDIIAGVHLSRHANAN